jgi:hypothetical protein
MAGTEAPLSPRQIADLLHSVAEMVQSEWTALPDSVLGWHPEPGEWCIKETLGHVIEAERHGFAGRIRTILDADEPRLQGWDQEEVARERRDCEREPAGLLNEFLEMRRDSVALAAALRPEDLPRGGEHPDVGYLRVADLLQEWVHHDRNHFKQMLTKVQADAWPHMGNSQRFALIA